MEEIWAGFLQDHVRNSGVWEASETSSDGVKGLRFRGCGGFFRSVVLRGGGGGAASRLGTYRISD